MDLLSIIIIVFSAIILGIAAKFYMDLTQKEYTEDRIRQTFAAQSRGMEDEAVSAEFAEYQQSVIEHIDSRLTDRFPLLGDKILQAGYKIKALEWSLIVAFITIVTGFLPMWLLQSTFGLWAIFFSICVVFLVPVLAYFILNMHIGKRVTIFDEQFGVGLDVMSASMKAGGTFMSSIKFIAEGSEPPLATEMGILATELGLGTDMNTALDRFKTRIPSKNLLIFVIAIKVANQTGSALAPILSTLSRVIVQRFRLQGLINIAISENIMGICILASFPWIVIPLLAFAWPEAYSEFFSWDPGGIPIGKLIAFISFVWYCIGINVMYKTVKSIDT
ncbi:MAG: type II secretion system F family protein [Candidatus Caenarcaniphilales bacterium]|nr:type II secretion system F family protein [Candidatus Caenarcaniphilales bacterium]